MEKPAQNEHPIHELIRRRWSPRAFQPRALPSEALASLFEAARWAPSSRNGQPWAFIVGARQDAEQFQRVLACLSEKNALWARHASALLISVACVQREDGRPNRHGWHDLGMACANLTVQANDLGLYTHFVGGFDAEKARESFDIPAEWEPVTAIAVGYGGDPVDLPEELQRRETAPRTRKALAEFVFTGEWGRSAPFTHGSIENR